MNKLMSILALASLIFSPSCRNLHFWRKSEPTVQTDRKSDKPQKKKDKTRKSGPAGWELDLDKE